MVSDTPKHVPFHQLRPKHALLQVTFRRNSAEEAGGALDVSSVLADQNIPLQIRSLV